MIPFGENYTCEYFAANPSVPLGSEKVPLKEKERTVKIEPSEMGSFDPYFLQHSNDVKG